MPPNREADNVFTYALTNANGDSNTGKITINSDYGVQKISICGTSANTTLVKGNKALGALASADLSLGNGDVVTIVSNGNAALSGIVIDCVTNNSTCNIVANL